MKARQLWLALRNGEGPPVETGRAVDVVEMIDRWPTLLGLLELVGADWHDLADTVWGRLEVAGRLVEQARDRAWDGADPDVALEDVLQEWWDRTV